MRAQRQTMRARGHIMDIMRHTVLTRHVELIWPIGGT
jgi:hypothetical protein